MKRDQAAVRKRRKKEKEKPAKKTRPSKPPDKKPARDKLQRPR
jgi:hypothetical protein